MTTITILGITQIPANPEFNVPATQSATFAVKGTGSAYQWSRGGLAAELTQAQIQTQLNSEADALLADAIASGAPTMTDAQVAAGNYAWLHWSNRDTFAAASYQLEVGIFGVAQTLASYQAVIQSALNALIPLAGSVFQTNFDNERTAQGLPTANTASAYTQAQCRSMDTFLRAWLAARKADVLWAKTIVGLS